MRPDKIISISIEKLDLILETIVQQDPRTPVVEVSRIVHQVLDKELDDTTYDIAEWDIERQAWRVSRELEVRKDYPDKKILCIKTVRTLFGFHLREAKEIFEYADDKGFFFDPL